MAAVNYTIRLDDADKKSAEQVFNQLGLTLAAGINVYLKAVARQQGIPFALEIERTPRQRLQDAFSKAQAQSAINGTNKMSMTDIDAVIADSRQQV